MAKILQYIFQFVYKDKRTQHLKKMFWLYCSDEDQIQLVLCILTGKHLPWIKVV